MTSIWQRGARSLASSKRKGHRTGLARTGLARTGLARTGLARTGAAVVEFAFVAPLLIMLTFGMIELGRLVMVKQLLINASREGARLAVLPASTEDEVLAQVQTELSNATIHGATVVLTPSSLANAPAGSPVTVSISISSAAVSWIPKPMFVFNQTLEASTTMRRESM